MIELDDVPDLVDPVVVAAFEGWNDAAESASAALDHLAEAWDATAVGAIDPDEFYDFQVNRPTVSLDGSKQRRLTWPTTRVLVARPDGARHDVVLLRGVEPNLRWRQFCAELLAAVDSLGGHLVVTLGALLADVPHTRPIPVSGTATDPELARGLGVSLSGYEGPTGIVGVLQDACRLVDLPAVSLWAAVPHYVAQLPCPKATMALVHRVEDLLDVTVPLDDLPAEGRAWEQRVEELAREDTEVAAYVRTLEEHADTTGLPEASGEAIAREFERYLRRGPHREG